MRHSHRLMYMQQIRTPTTDAAIVGRLDKPDHSDFSPEAARNSEYPAQCRGPGADAGDFPQSPGRNAHADRAGRGGKLSAGRILARYPLVESAALPETRRHGRHAWISPSQLSGGSGNGVSLDANT